MTAPGSGSGAVVGPDLQAHLDTGITTLAWCWRITRTDGQVFGFTDHDRPLAFDGTAFEPESGLTASELRADTELSVDSQDAEGALSSDTVTEIDIRDGRWDDAEVEVWRVNWTDVAERALLRRGSIGQVRRGRVAFVAEVRSLAHRLNQTVGRQFQYGCDAELGDGRCRVDLDQPAFKGVGSVATLISERRFTAGGLGGFDDGWFTFGVVTWTSGANAGRRGEVLSHNLEDGVARIALLEPPVRPVAVGDSFEVVAGCDKRLPTCRDKFANTANFRGFPHIPGQETVVRFAKQGEANSGEPL